MEMLARFWDGRSKTLAMYAREGREAFPFSGQIYLENVINLSK